MTLIVREAQLGEVRPLQLAVLRPAGPLPHDRPPPPGATFVAALLEDRVVGAATLVEAPWPGPVSIVGPAVQLRGMAVAPDSRYAGVGRAILAAALRHATRRGAVVLWAQARTSALGFYERSGWTAVGDEWIKAGVGPHRYIRTAVPPH